MGKHDAVSVYEEVADSQYFPECSDLSVHHLSLFHRVSIQLLQVSFSKQGAETHHLLVSMKHKFNRLLSCHLIVPKITDQPKKNRDTTFT